MQTCRSFRSVFFNINYLIAQLERFKIDYMVKKQNIKIHSSLQFLTFG